MSETKQKKSAIEQSALMNEIIKRDKKFYSINKNFHLDLKTLKIIAMKPNYIKKEHLDIEQRAKDIPEDIRDKIQTELFKIPSERYQFPLTQSQEIGWDSAEGLNTHQRMAKNTTDVTTYAAEYAKLNGGRSPYATKEIVPGKGK